MLRDEHRVAAPRRLPAVVRGLGRREALRDEGIGVPQHGLDALLAQVVRIASLQAELPPKARCGEAAEDVVEVSHPVRKRKQPRLVNGAARARIFSACCCMPSAGGEP
jgi:hypothetical protein